MKVMLSAGGQAGSGEWGCRGNGVPGQSQAWFRPAICMERFLSSPPQEPTFSLLQRIKWNLSERVGDTGSGLSRERAENSRGGDRQPEWAKPLALLVAYVERALFCWHGSAG